MLANFLIGLREGLEATLVVTILVAYLVKTGHRTRLRPIWIGAGAAVAVAIAFGGALTLTSHELSATAEPAFAGTMSIVAVAFVTWMIFWMRRTARFMAAELRNRLASALLMGSVALALTAFAAVAREGIETSLFLWAAAQTAGSSATPLIGALLGIATAVVLGYLLYRRAVTINLAKFFTWTGAGLILVAAGVLAYGMHDLQEAGLLPGERSIAFDVSGAVPESSWYGTLLKGTLNFSPVTTWLAAITWLVYVSVVMVLFFRPARTAATSNGVPAVSTAAPRPAEARQAQ